MNSDSSPARIQLPVANRDLLALRAEGRGLYASVGELFSMAIFGRDSIEAADDLLHINPQVAQEVILWLAALQGTQRSPWGLHTNQEEVGAISHEYRSLYIANKRVSKQVEKHFLGLSDRCGGTAEAAISYESVDATPLYVRLIADYCAIYGPAILAKRVVKLNHPHHGVQESELETVTVQEAVIAALGWITRRIKESPLGLVEFQRRNPHGIEHQGWEDSATSCIHEDGTLVNHDAPIALIEVQGWAYDALVEAAQLFSGIPELDKQVESWRLSAKELRRNTFAELWMDDKEYFALGMDRDLAGEPRQIRTLAANAATLMDSQIFFGLDDEKRKMFLQGIVNRVFSKEFLTEAGVRCRSDRYELGFADYHGSMVVWPKHTGNIANGLRKQGYATLAMELEKRILNSVNIGGGNNEFMYVDPITAVPYLEIPIQIIRGADCWQNRPIVKIAGTNHPDGRAQAWTVTEVLNIKHRLGNRFAQVIPLIPTWQVMHQRKVLNELPYQVRLLRTKNDVAVARNHCPVAVVDLREGHVRESEVLTIPHKVATHPKAATNF